MIDAIDGNEAMRLLEEVVKEKGSDYVYPAEYRECKYFVQDGGSETAVPACIVGWALHKKGWLFQPPDDGLQRMIDSNESAYEFSEYSDVITSEAAEVFSAAQMAQDGRDGVVSSRGTWGKALKAARAALVDERG